LPARRSILKDRSAGSVIRNWFRTAARMLTVEPQDVPSACKLPYYGKDCYERSTERRGPIRNDTSDHYEVIQYGQRAGWSAILYENTFVLQRNQEKLENAISRSLENRDDRCPQIFSLISLALQVRHQLKWIFRRARHFVFAELYRRMHMAYHGGPLLRHRYWNFEASFHRPRTIRGL